jgi:hypothetical protein
LAPAGVLVQHELQEWTVNLFTPAAKTGLDTDPLAGDVAADEKVTRVAD